MNKDGSKVGDPRVPHQDDIQELIDTAIMADRAKRHDFGGGSSEVEVQALIDADQTSQNTANNAKYIPFNGTSVTVPNRLTGQWATEVVDTNSNLGGILHIDHYGTGGSSSYGLDIRNRNGANQAFVIHQYGNTSPAMQLDNTDTNALLQLRNSNNQTLNPGGAANGASATGDFLRCVDTNGVQLLNLLGRGEILMHPGADAVGHGVEIVGAASTKRLIKTTMNGAATGIEFVAASGSTGFYPLVVTGYDYGPSFTTSQDGSGRSVLLLTKNGIGAGYGLNIVHKGTSTERALRIANATTEVFSVDASGRAYLIKATAPSANAAGGLIYVDASGNLHYRGPTTDSQIAVA
jgi:hypothetical protein